MISKQQEPRARQLPYVLSVGSIKDLLKARERLLTQAGFQVISTSSTDQALELAQAGYYAGAILGATLPDAVRKEIASAVRRRNPSAVIVMLYSEAIQQAELADAVLNVHTSADALPEVFRDLFLTRAGTGIGAGGE